MANEPILTVVGNLTADPELRFTPNGKAVANFTVASTPRRKDGDSWVDGDTTFLSCAAWDVLGENVSGTLAKGMRVIVQGAMSSRNYETKDGRKGTSLELRVEAVGPELRWATANVTRTQGGGGGGQQRQAPAHDPWAAPAPQGGQQRPPQGQQQGDPWSRPSSAPQSDPWAGQDVGYDPNAEPPF